jgi:hypothetical protein
MKSASLAMGVHVLASLLGVTDQISGAKARDCATSPCTSFSWWEGLAHFSDWQGLVRAMRGAHRRQVLVDLGHGRRAFADGTANPLDRT